MTSNEGARDQENDPPGSDPPGDNEDYKVGYQRPPLHSRFKAGISGNPKGRRKQFKPRNIQADIQQVYLREIPVRDGDSKKKIAAVVVLHENLVRAGIKGDLKSVNSALRHADDLGVVRIKDEVGVDLSVLTPEERAICDAALPLFHKARFVKPSK